MVRNLRMVRLQFVLPIPLHGIQRCPVRPVALLQNLGPVYYIVLAIELVVWISLGSLLVKKVVNKTRDRVQPVALAA